MEHLKLVLTNSKSNTHKFSIGQFINSSITGSSVYLDIYAKHLTSIANLEVLNAAITNFSGETQINRNDKFCSTILEADSHQKSGDFVQALTYEQSNFSSGSKRSKTKKIKYAR